MIARLRALAARVAGLLRRRPDAGFDDEMRTHLQLLTERYMRQGLAPADAASAARRQFGNSTLLQEDRREMQTVLALEHAWRSLRYSVRQLRITPGFTVAAILSLALGIGVNTAVFTLLDQLVLRLLPVPSPERLVMIWSTGPNLGDTRGVRASSFPLCQTYQRKADRVRQRVLQILQRSGDHRGRQHGAGSGRARVGKLLRRPSRRTIGRPGVLGERRRSHRSGPSGCRDQFSLLGRSPRPSSRHRGEEDPRQRAPDGGRGSCQRGLQRHGPGAGASHLAAAADEGADDAGRRRAQRSSLRFRSGVRTVESGIHRGVGPRLSPTAVPPVTRRRGNRRSDRKPLGVRP